MTGKVACPGAEGPGAADIRRRCGRPKLALKRLANELCYGYPAICGAASCAVE
ncbi:MAG: hypothetical protein M3401_16515 [Actinomycetota bacterium]|nr:hypothetical protein [Actinomycetota bacterium]